MSSPNPQSSPVRRLDPTALTAPIDQQAVDAFMAEAKATNKPWSQMTTGVPRPGVSELISALLPFVIPLVGLLAIISAGGWSLISAVWRFTFEAPFPLNLVIVGFLLLILLGVAGAGLRVLRIIQSFAIPREWWESGYRITRFAAANGLRYGHDELVDYPGVIFGSGSDRVAERRLTTTAGRRVEIGNYRYTITGDDRENVRVYGWGYVAIALDRRLPHLLLDAKANDTSVFGIRTSNLPTDLARDQQLSLGGEFDEKFTLYAPSNYGRDAFLIFAPDLMALFIDRLGTFDVEIIDDTMFVYGGRFDLFSPATYAWLTELVDTVVARTVRRTGRYKDDFAALEADPTSRPPTLAPPPAPSTPSAPADTTFELFPGVPLANSQPPPSTATPPTTAEPVFAFSGDGPPQEATNTVAAQGRRLRTRRWGLWTIVGILFILIWVYDDFIAPLFGLPHLRD